MEKYLLSLMGIAFLISTMNCIFGFGIRGRFVMMDANIAFNHLMICWSTIVIAWAVLLGHWVIHLVSLIGSLILSMMGY